MNITIIKLKGGFIMKLIKYAYLRSKNMNCEKICGEEEYEAWKKLDAECGHKLKMTEYGYICYIDY